LRIASHGIGEHAVHIERAIDFIGRNARLAGVTDAAEPTRISQ
jgi:hypothetical protein